MRGRCLELGKLEMVSDIRLDIEPKMLTRARTTRQSAEISFAGRMLGTTGGDWGDRAHELVSTDTDEVVVVVKGNVVGGGRGVGRAVGAAHSLGAGRSLWLIYVEVT
jgi:hypothetical protein